MVGDDESAVCEGGVRVADAVYRKLNLLEDYVKLLEGLKGRDFTDPYMRGALERYMQLAAECALDLGEMLIALKGLRKANSYREVIGILGEYGVLDANFAHEFAGVASLRNVLVHDYERVDPARVIGHLSRLDDFRRFGRDVARFLQTVK